MNAAVQAGIPFGVKFAHFHGGETTLGAIDNIYRHQITLVAKIHFTSHEFFKEKVSELIGSKNNIFNVGSLSLTNIGSFKPVSKEKLIKQFGVPNKDFVLVTIHPETIALSKNSDFIVEIKSALFEISKNLNIVITMPNADTFGSIYRIAIEDLKKELPNKLFIVENFGKLNYFSAMLFSKLLIGNTSSGILEAASFGKYVVNIGDRQKGRLQSNNIFNVPFESHAICLAVNNAISKGSFNGKNIYSQKNSVNKIIKILKKMKSIDL